MRRALASTRTTHTQPTRTATTTRVTTTRVTTTPITITLITTTPITTLAMAAGVTGGTGMAAITIIITVQARRRARSF
ncbi:MAG TPA: hypothetical protein VG937_18155 [Polyangiaceae bacterium]|nr:hypothetical protein [Polyangiaceae bacterium]